MLTRLLGVSRWVVGEVVGPESLASDTGSKTALFDTIKDCGVCVGAKC
jgi:hypothetical protein